MPRIRWLLQNNRPNTTMLRNENRGRRVKWPNGTATSIVGHALKTVECSRATSPFLLELTATRNALHRGEEAEPLSAAVGTMLFGHTCLL